MATKHAAVAAAVLSMLALAAPAQAGRENPACERYAEDITQAKQEVADATAPARKAARKLKSAKNKLKNAEGDKAKKAARAKVRKAKKARNRTKAALEGAQGNLNSAERRYEGRRCGEGDDDRGGGGKERPGKPR